MDNAVLDNENPTLPEPTEAQADADFDAGFAPEPTEPPELPAIVDPALTQKPEPTPDPEPAPLPTPTFVQLTAEDHQRLLNGLAELQGRTERIGDLERSLKAMQEATPSGQQIQISPEDFAELKADFPELADLQLKGLTRVFEKFKGTGPAFTPPQIEALVAERTRQIAEQAALDTMDLVHEGWRETVNSPEYRAWFAAQPESYRKVVETTWKPAVMRQSINAFQATKAATSKPAGGDPADLRRSRLAAAVATPSTGGNPTGRSDDDEFLAGFNGR